MAVTLVAALVAFSTLGSAKEEKKLFDERSEMRDSVIGPYGSRLSTYMQH